MNASDSKVEKLKMFNKFLRTNNTYTSQLDCCTTMVL